MRKLIAFILFLPLLSYAQPSKPPGREIMNLGSWGTSNHVLTSRGLSNAPVWKALTNNADFTNNVVTKLDGLSGQVLLIVTNIGGNTNQLALTTNGQTLTIALTNNTNAASVSGITSLNGLSGASQTLAVGTSGSDFAVSSSGSTHTFNLPTASATVRGALSSANWSTFNAKESALTFNSPIARAGNTISIPAASGSANGYLSSGDWTTFNGKEAALTHSAPLSRTGNTISIPKSDASTDGYLDNADFSTFSAKESALTFSSPLSRSVNTISLNALVNANISVSAAISESKLALNFPTHSNANDPTTDQKAALAGTQGTPSAINKYVTSTDTRLSDSRPPTGSAGGDLTGTYPNPSLAAAGTAGTYTKVTTDSKGRVTSGTTLSASDIPTLDASKITSGTITSPRLIGALNSGQFENVGSTISIKSGVILTNPFVFGELTANTIIGSFLGDAVLVSESTGAIAESATSTTELGYLVGVTSAIQTQLDNKQPLDSDLTVIAGFGTTGIMTRTGTGTAATRTITAGTGISVSNGNGVSGNPTIAANLSASDIPNLDASKITSGDLSYARMINAFNAGQFHAVGTTISLKPGLILTNLFTFGDLTANTIIGSFLGDAVLVSEATGAIAESSTSTTELGYLVGVTSPVQTQLDGKQPLDSDLTAIAVQAGNGLYAKTSSGNAATRSITSSGNGISVSNGDGISGNPTLSINLATFPAQNYVTNHTGSVSNSLAVWGHLTVATNFFVTNIATIASNAFVGGNLLVTNSITNLTLTANNGIWVDANKKLTTPTGTQDGTKFLRDDGTWANTAASVAGANKQVQFNNAAAFGADSSFTFDNVTKILGAGIGGTGGITNGNSYYGKGTLTNEGKAVFLHSITNAGALTNVGLIVAKAGVSNESWMTVTGNQTNSGALIVGTTNITTDIASRSKVLFVQTADATIVNTTTETTLIAAGAGSVTLPANFLEAGRKINIRVRGRAQSFDGSASVTLRLRLGGVGGTILVSEAGIGIPDFAGGVNAEFEFTCRTTGVTGTVVASGEFKTHESTTGFWRTLSNAGTVTVDTTASLAITPTIQWTAADASNTITIQQLEITSSIP